MQQAAPFPQTRRRAGMPRRAGRRWRWAILPLLLLAAAGGYLWWRSAQQAATPATSTARVSQGDLTIAVSGSGTVAAARTVDLAFQQSGTISSVDVKVGDTVMAGQTLATIDTADLELAVQQAQANLAAAQASYDQTKNGSATEQDLASAQASLTSAEAQLAQTKSGSATAADIASARAALASAQAKLDALKNPSAADLNAAQSKVTQAQTSLQSTRDSASQSKTNAELALQNSANSLTQAQAKYSTALQQWEYARDTGNDPTQPNTTSSTGESVPNKLTDAQRQQYYDAYIQADAALKTAENQVQQSRVAYDAARQKEVLDVQQAEAVVADAQASFDVLKNPSAADLIQAQAAVTQAQASLSKLTAGGTAADIAQSQASVTQAQANLDKLSAPPTDAELTSAEASLLQAQVGLDTARRNLEQATLAAPFDGVVSAVTAQVGASAGSSTAAVTIVDRSTLHVDVSLSETDAAKVQVGQPVTLTFDALPDATLTGTVTTIAPAATTSQNVVTYPAQIEFDPGDSAVKVGMSATADIQVEQYTGAILVPTRAVTTAGGVSTVTVLQGSERAPTTVRVETGATSNGQTIIVSCVDTGAQCLNVGDTLQVGGATTTTSSTNANQNPGITGGFSGGGPGGPPSGAP